MASTSLSPAPVRTTEHSAHLPDIAGSYFGETQPKPSSETDLHGLLEPSKPDTPTQGTNAMAASSTAIQPADGFKPVRLDISNLISPPVGLYDSFSSSAVARIARKAPADLNMPESSRTEVPLSPPISTGSVSPAEKKSHNISPTPAHSVPVKDPILYPNPDASSSAARPLPLFGPQASAPAEPAVAQDGEHDTDRIIHEHIRAAGHSSEGERPTEEEYRMVLRFKSNVLHQFQADRLRWLNQEKALLAADRAASYRARPLSMFSSRPAAKPQLARGGHPTKPQPIRSSVNRVQKPLKGKEPRVAKPQAPRPIRTSAGPVRPSFRVSSTPEPRVRTVAPNREDKDFLSLQDYSPPVMSLGNKSLKVDWKGNALDLSKDPHAHLLHPEELHLAASLRLDCATYLTSKRRIFLRRLECYRLPKPFRKTDAQQACKIDVNKASKLWTAYDSVGWFDDQWLRPFVK